ncbi:MAG: ABC transporter ATP-binding protein, partial [Clostridia bacterium]|nr:ABC transporter ATP-binding protein [Clostridia bacterium]
TEGKILLNGIDITRYKYDEYMRLFAVVFQDFRLFGFTLGENIAASQEYDREWATACLEKAGFGDRLRGLARGLDTPIGREYRNDGEDLSGGEQQKVAIARALYKNSPFIILDEPTAALDPLAEAEIYSHLNEIVDNKTAIYISHRLSSCRFCDHIVVFHEGELVEQGTHNSLVSDETTKYYQLWNAQAQYYT